MTTPSAASSQHLEPVRRVGSRPEDFSAGPRWPGADRVARHWPTWALAVTALGYAVSQFQVWPVHLAWDELVYFSQVSRTTPAAFFSAPRARGISWLAEPVAALTSSPYPLRIYLAVLSSLALFLVFRVWLKLLSPGAVDCAAVFFASLWCTRFYGAELMPNLWVAFGALAAVGGFLRLAADRADRAAAAALGIGLAVEALMRPSDAAWTAAPLLVIALVTPAWRRHLRLLLVIVAGAGLGALPWVVEAHYRYGGLRARLRRAGQIEGGIGWHPSLLLQHWRTLDGPLLCRPCHPAPTPPPNTLWLLLIPLGAILAVLILRRSSQARLAVVPALVGASQAVPYLLLIGYSAPRFLLPALGLLSVPVGVALAGMVSWGRSRRGWGYLLAGLLVAGLAVQAIAQQPTLVAQVSGQRRITASYAAMAADLHQAGLQAPCVVSGRWAPAIGYYSGCSSRETDGHDKSISYRGLIALARQRPTAIVTLGTSTTPHLARTWPRRPLPGSPNHGSWVFYLSPGTP